jgi:regulation of enolase protein 1 (concanavalin A-like superfamily)
VLSALILCSAIARSASASDQIFFPAVDNVTNLIIQRINAETVRIDVSAWYLTEHAISIALVNRFKAGVPVRLIGDRVSIFEIDPNTRTEFYFLANAGVPIRLRYNPTWYPEIDHWKMAIFAGQNVVEFGSANWTTFELAPWSSTDYDDETAMFADDPVLVGAFKTKFDRMWNDTTTEPQARDGAPPPYLKNWNAACLLESACADFKTQYPNSLEPDNINTARLEPNNPLPADLIWGQGPDFNNRLVTEINNEPSTGLIQFVIYRMTVDNITQALLARKAAGGAIQLIVEPNEYLNKNWPEFEITHANLDKLWAAGISMRQRAHQGLTHMKTLITATYATNASSNYAAAWQRDHDYFVSATAKPSIYTAIKNRFQAMWSNTSSSTGFVPFQPQPPYAPALASPANGATGVATNSSLIWNRAFFATNFDVYLGTSASTMTRVGNVAAQMDNNPPSTYFWTPALCSGTTYYWQIVSRTNATPVDASMIMSSATRSFTTAGNSCSGGTPPAAPTNPSPSNGATGVSTSTSLGWSAGAAGTTFNVAFGTANPPPQVATGLSSSSYAPGALVANTTYYWRITAVSSGGSTAGSLWSFATATGGGGGGLPTPWTTQDIGSVGLTGNASYTNGTFTVQGAGSDIWDAADSFRYVSQPMSGDAQIVARVTGLQNTNTYAKAGVMLRESLSAGSAHVILDVRPDGSIEFMKRSSTGASTTWLAGGTQAFPAWLKLTRSGSTITGFVSANGTTWTTVGTTTLSIATAANIGLAVTSHNASALNTATFDNVTVTAGPPPPPPPPPPPLPSPWTNQDVGSVGIAGSASYSSGTFTVTGAGADIWGTADGFQFVSHPLSGDGQVVARVASLQNTNTYAKAGLMLRATTAAGSAHVILDVRPNGSLEFMTRSVTGGSTAWLSGGTQAVPAWLKLTRTGNTITGYASANGTTWTQIGSTTTSIPTSALIGLVVTSHDTSVTNTATFDNVAP